MFLLDTVVQRYWLPTSRPDPGVAPILLPFNPNVMKRYPSAGASIIRQMTILNVPLRLLWRVLQRVVWAATRSIQMKWMESRSRKPMNPIHRQIKEGRAEAADRGEK
jgi:hypothetical protein